MEKNQKTAYRWVVLTIYSLLSIMIQVQWLSFAPIAREARLIYGVSPFYIDALSLLFMLVYLPVCFPASALIEKYDLRIGLGIGAVLMAFFSMLKGFYSANYWIIFIAQTGLAVAQPFFLNTSTKLAVKWFPVNERVTAVGIATLAQFVGIVLVMLLTPMMLKVQADGSTNIHSILMNYGIAALVVSALFFVLVRKDHVMEDVPATARHFTFREGLNILMKKSDVLLISTLFFIGLGQFNAISTCIDQICEVKKLSIDQTGMVGGLMLIAGILGAFIFPPISDYLRRRKPFLILSMVLTTLGILGLALSQNYLAMLISSFILGFFLLGAGAPVGFQYAAEMSDPVPESFTQGLVLFAGQVSGILFIIAMNYGGMIPLLLVFTAMGIINIYISIRISESPVYLEHVKVKAGNRRN